MVRWTPKHLRNILAALGNLRLSPIHKFMLHFATHIDNFANDLDVE